MSGAGLRNSNRALHDAADQVLLRDPSFCRCGRVFRIRCKIRVWIYLDDEGLAGRIDTKIDARIAAEPEPGPGGQRELLERFGKLPIEIGQSASALPLCSDVDLLGNR
jgi:hypothetical protein